jgi:adenosylcobyric acid synthase
LHGIFASDTFRAAYLGALGASSTVVFEDQVEETLDALAAHIETYFDLDALLLAAAEVN